MKIPAAAAGPFGQTTFRDRDAHPAFRSQERQRVVPRLLAGARSYAKRAATWLPSAALLIGIALGPPAPRLIAADETVAVATVNGDTITQREFVEALRRSRTKFSDATKLRQAALEDCVRFKVLQQLARDQHLLDDPSDAALRRAFVQENTRRTQASARGEVIYGPKQLTWESFRLTWHDRIQRELTQHLADRAGPATEAELRQFHTEHAAKFTAPRASAPQPFEELRDHVLAEFHDEKFADVFLRAVTAADVRPNAARIAALEPNTPLADQVAR